MIYDISEQYPDNIVTYHCLNIPSDLIYDKCYLFYAKTKNNYFTFLLVIANSIIFDYLRFLTS